MQKHRGLPEFMYGTNIRIAIRRDADPVTPIKRRERASFRPSIQTEADEFMLSALYRLYGDQPFVRGNIDAGRLSWLIGREIIALDTPFNPSDYDSLLKINKAVALKTFPNAFE
jgi:hypothetical protein